MNCRGSKLLFLLLVISVTLLFFVQLPAGSFQATNGPTTPVTHWRLLLPCLFAILCWSSLLLTARAVQLYLGPKAIDSIPFFAPATAEISLRC